MNDYISDLFALGMKRDIPPLIPGGLPAVNLGCGASLLPGATNLDLPSWNAERDPLQFGNGSVETIYAFHFFEHLRVEHVVRVLRECERVLRPGGTLNVVVPHRLSQMAYHDLDHKTVWTEETWRVLFSTPYYEKMRPRPWRFDIGTNVIIGIVERNLALMTQLIRKED